MKPLRKAKSHFEQTFVKFCQDKQENVTSSKDLEVNGGLNLAVKRAKPSNTGPILGNAGVPNPKVLGRRRKSQHVKRLENNKLQ